MGWNRREFIEKFGKIPIDFHIDHKVPISWFKTTAPINIINNLENLQLIHSSDNLKKQNRYSHQISYEFLKIVKFYIKEEYQDRLVSEYYPWKHILSWSKIKINEDH